MSKRTFMSQDKSGSCSLFGIKSTLWMMSLLLLISTGFLSYLCGWTLISKLKYSLLSSSSSIYALSTYLLLICSLLTTIAILCIFITAWIEHQQGLRWTLLILAITFLIELIAGLLSFVYTVNLSDRLSSNLLSLIEYKYHVDTRKEQDFDQMQIYFRCCGSTSFKDWSLSPRFNSNNTAFVVPDSCCKSFEHKCAQKPFGIHPSNIYYQGCSQALYRYYHQHLVTLGCVAIGVTFLQVFTIIPLFWLIKRLQKQLAHSIAPITTNKQHHLSQELSYIPIQQGET